MCFSYAVSTAADSWQALMDRFLTIGDDQPQEKYIMEQNLLRLVDLYYDALDQPKKGGEKVSFLLVLHQQSQAGTKFSGAVQN